MRIGLDVMGGDFAPSTTIKGALFALRELPDSFRIILIGNGTVMIGRGISNDKAIKNMLLYTVEVIQARLSEKIKQAFQE